jgi:hypothetical protein
MILISLIVYLIYYYLRYTQLKSLFPITNVLSPAQESFLKKDILQYLAESIDRYSGYVRSGKELKGMVESSSKIEQLMNLKDGLINQSLTKSDYDTLNTLYNKRLTFLSTNLWQNFKSINSSFVICAWVIFSLWITNQIHKFGNIDFITAIYIALVLFLGSFLIFFTQEIS